MTKITNIKRTMTSAATVIAGDNTDVADLKGIDDLTSECGDWFKSEASQNTLDWIYADKRQEPLFTLDGRSQEILAERGASHIVPRTLPVHTVPKFTSMPVSDLNASSGKLTHLPSGDTTGVTLGSHSSSPALSSPQMLIEGQPAEDSEEPRTPISDPDPKSNTVQTDMELLDRSRLSPPMETAEKPIKKSRRRRLSWFRTSKSADSLTVRSPMMDDKQSGWLGRRNTKLPRKLKIVFVGDGASGKTCLIM